MSTFFGHLDLSKENLKTLNNNKFIDCKQFLIHLRNKQARRDVVGGEELTNMLITFSKFESKAQLEAVSADLIIK